MDDHGYCTVLTKQEYRDGCLIDDDPRLLEEPARLVEYERESEVVNGRMSYDRRDPFFIGPPAFAGEMLANVQSWRHGYTVSPPVAVAELHDAVVCQHVVYVEQRGESRVIYESFRPNDRPYTRLISRQQAKVGRAYRGLSCYLGAVGTQSYPHWVIDILPRAAIAAARAKSPVRWLIPSYDPDLDRVKAESLADTIGYEPEIAFVDDEDVLHVDRLLYMSPTSYHPMLKSPPAMLDLRDRIARSTGPSPVNTAAVASLLARYGFETLDSEDLSFAERKAAFCGASIVAGVMGGGMANTLFCPAGSHIIHLAPQGWLEPLYWDLASILGQTYSCIYGPAASTEAPPHTGLFGRPGRSHALPRGAVGGALGPRRCSLI